MGSVDNSILRFVASCVEAYKCRHGGVNNADGGVNGGVNSKDGGVNSTDGGVKYADGGVKDLLDVVKANPGMRVPEIAKLLNVSARTVERNIAAMSDKIEFRGAPKTGGYYVRSMCEEVKM